MVLANAAATASQGASPYTTCACQAVMDERLCITCISHAMCMCACALSQGVLLYGPPGTGKTLLARAVAHHTDCTFIRVSGSELVQKYIGEGSRMVRELFVMAREHAPSIIFMDEVRYPVCVCLFVCVPCLRVLLCTHMLIVDARPHVPWFCGRVAIGARFVEAWWWNGGMSADRACVCVCASSLHVRRLTVSVQRVQITVVTVRCSEPCWSCSIS